MAVLVITTIPGGVPLEQVLAVDKAVAAGGPPQGGISHAIIQEGDAISVFDIWESEQALRTFQQERLRPAIREAMAARGMEGEPPEPDQQVIECVNVMSVNYQG